MLRKTTKPVIGIITGSFVSGNRDSGATSPRTPTESKTQSPRKSFDFGGVGLGIVAALEKSGSGGVNTQANKALFGRNLTRSNPIPVNSQRNSWRSAEKMEMESSEEYTVVTCHGPNETYTKVYSGAEEGGRKGHDRTPLRIQSSKKSNRASVFHISPERYDDGSRFPAPDFLSSCNLCQKKLHGKDIYMYRGEKAFCSTECRYRQIVMDERKEKCRSEVSRPAAELAGSPYPNGQMFTTGILAI